MYLPKSNIGDAMTLQDELFAKIKVLSDKVWDRRADEPLVREWLANFSNESFGDIDQQKLHALYLLSRYMYFGGMQLREMLKVLFRDLYKYPIIAKYRQENANTTDLLRINEAFEQSLKQTLFLGVGNPSESGCHLLYYFRQENGLPKQRFIHSHEIFERKTIKTTRLLWSILTNRSDRYAGTISLRNPNIDRYVFIDDFCGSGHQADSYSRTIVEDIKSFHPSCEVSYFVLCGTAAGMKSVRSSTKFDRVESVFELDDSFKCFSDCSRYFPTHNTTGAITKQFAKSMCEEYGVSLFDNALGYNDGQLLLSFTHNTPDNTLPIFWADEHKDSPWTPMFKRYPKSYA